MRRSPGDPADIMGLHFHKNLINYGVNEDDFDMTLFHDIANDNSVVICCIIVILYYSCII